jgi:RNase P subunit RPR2
MIPAASNKGRSEAKVPEKTKSGTSIRLPVKKTFCSHCKKLIKGQKQISGNATRIICPKCNQNLWIWNNLSWKSIKNSPVIST